MAQAKLTPLGGNILVKPVTEEAVSESGIVLPDTVDKERSQRGEIIALGSGRVTPEGKTIPFNVKVGDTVLFKKYSNEEVEVDGEEYLIMSEDAILAIIN
ncbi:MAG: 10 kDa chaperonin [candidate division WS6 bacterium OLB20]|uniref:Co-chaperonin GroES n=1 Tax=candidate division WS6 bacterium OLB20 TaxID=1617426 RepID=A0A136LYX1_9BACT|nr:MAG: 10 kDa chaperonin [candidate division WS6 bacterium OLB20]